MARDSRVDANPAREIDTTEPFLGQISLLCTPIDRTTGAFKPRLERTEWSSLTQFAAFLD